MHTLNRNCQKVYYALYKGIEDQYDKDGNQTGEPLINYEEPVQIFLNVSAARGNTDVELFGINLNYTKTLVTHDVNCPISENSILWIGIIPEKDIPHNYIVVKVAKSINSIAYAVREVDIKQ